MYPTLLAAVLLALFAGCKQEAQGDAPAGAAPSELRGKLEGLADRGCACKDGACAQEVRAAVLGLADGTQEVADGELASLQAAQARLDQCLAALNPAVVEYRALTEEVCTCADAACARKASSAFSRWAASLKAAKEKLPPSDAQLLVAAGTKAAACLQKFDLPVPR